MQYKIVVTTTKLSTAKKVHNLLAKSKVYNSEEIMSLNPIKEVCEECARND